MMLIQRPLAQRWNTFGTSIFSEMTLLAKKFGAVNLAQGFPDFPGPQKLLNAVSQQLLECHNQYSPSIGEEPLRRALSSFIEETVGVTYDPNTEITVTTGATEAIYTVINAFVNPGDRVVVFEPYFDSYAQAIANAGGILTPIRLHAPDTPLGLQASGWAIDWADFDAAAAGGFKLLLLNSPHNPTGKIFNPSELERIADKIGKIGALVVCDEVYEHLIYEDTPYVSLASFTNIRDQVIRISSAAKTFGFTGFKLGWVSASPSLTESIRLVHQCTVFSTNAHIQFGLAKVLEDLSWVKSYLDTLAASYTVKRDMLKRALEQAGFIVQQSYGTYFLMASYKNLEPGMTDVEFTKHLIQTRSIAAIPPSVFYVTPPKQLPWLRFAFCKKEETLIKASQLLNSNEPSDSSN